MVKKKKQKTKSKKKVILTVIIIAILLLGCLLCYIYKIKNSNTITTKELSEDFRYLMHDSENNDNPFVYKFSYDLKDDYKISVEFYENNVKVDEKISTGITGKGNYYFKLGRDDKFDIFCLGSTTQYGGWHDSPFSKDSSGRAYADFKTITNDPKAKSTLTINDNKKHYLFGIYLNFDYAGFEIKEGGTPTRIEAFIQKSK